MKIYQLVSYANAYNKRTKKWESQRSVQQVYADKAGLQTAYAEFEREKSIIQNLRTCNNFNKYSEVRGKVELQLPHIHENGTLAYWGDKVLQSYNPDNI